MYLLTKVLSPRALRWPAPGQVEGFNLVLSLKNLYFFWVQKILNCIKGINPRPQMGGDATPPPGRFCVLYPPFLKLEI